MSTNIVWHCISYKGYVILSNKSGYISVMNYMMGKEVGFGII